MTCPHYAPGDGRIVCAIAKFGDNPSPGTCARCPEGDSVPLPTVRSPGPADFPPLGRQAVNALAAAGRAVGAVLTGRRVKVAAATLAARRATCAACSRRDPDTDRCRQCGCLLKAKLRLATERCPLGKWPAATAAVPTTLTIGIAMPARDEGADVAATVASYLEAGADAVAVVDDASRDASCRDLPAGTRVAVNRTPMGPAFCRNLAAAMLGTDVVVFTDAHVRVVAGDLRAFAAAAVDRQALVQAAVQPLDGDHRWTLYGGRLIQLADGVLDVTANAVRPAANLAPVSAAWGSVYALPTPLFQRLGQWPPTLSHGYNEQALTLAAHFCAVPILVDTRFVIAHRFKKRFNYPVRRSTTHLNRFLVHHYTADPVWYADYWRPRLDRACPGVADRAAELLADPAREEARQRFAALKVVPDADVMTRLEAAGHHADPSQDPC